MLTLAEGGLSGGLLLVGGLPGGGFGAKGFHPHTHRHILEIMNVPTFLQHWYLQQHTIVIIMIMRPVRDSVDIPRT